jgi:hypothetical protein
MRSDPRSTRPAIRLAGEFVVIVVGVLVALGVDGYAEGRAERDRETDALVTLRADLTASLEDLRRDNQGTLGRSQTLTWFVNFPADGSQAFPEDSIRRVETAIHITSSYSPLLRTYDALIATGSLGLLTNDQIQFGLADIRRTADEYLDYREQTTDGWLFALMPIWLRVAGGDFSAEAVPAALRDRQFRGAVQVRRTFLRFTAEGGDELAQKMDAMVELVDGELSGRR